VTFAHFSGEVGTITFVKCVFDVPELNKTAAVTFSTADCVVEKKQAALAVCKKAVPTRSRDTLPTAARKLAEIRNVGELGAIAAVMAGCVAVIVAAASVGLRLSRIVARRLTEATEPADDTVDGFLSFSDNDSGDSAPRAADSSPALTVAFARGAAIAEPDHIDVGDHTSELFGTRGHSATANIVPTPTPDFFGNDEDGEDLAGQAPDLSLLQSLGHIGGIVPHQPLSFLDDIDIDDGDEPPEPSAAPPTAGRSRRHSRRMRLRLRRFSSARTSTPRGGRRRGRCDPGGDAGRD
jgi:hypothetical protein